MTSAENSSLVYAGEVRIETAHLGELRWDAASELFLPGGLPGFEEERRMIPVEIPAQRPLIFLQSAARSRVCFVSLPVLTICPEFNLELSEEDRAALMLAEEAPQIGADVLCLALLCPSGGTVKANLDAPVVINLHNSRCVQSLRQERDRGYYRLNEAAAWERVC